MKVKTPKGLYSVFRKIQFIIVFVFFTANNFKEARVLFKNRDSFIIFYNIHLMASFLIN